MPTSIYFALLEACSQPGCPLCRFTYNNVQRYFDSLLYESVNDRTVRLHLRRSLGFCREHAWQTVDSSSGEALGIAIIYHDVLTNVLRGFPDAGTPSARQPRLGTWLGSLSGELNMKLKTLVQALTPKERCPVCTNRDEMNALAVKELLQSILDEKLHKALETSEGLCLPHLLQSFEKVHDEPTFAALVALNHDKLEALNAELAELIRKNDYRFRDEGFGEERDSWKKVVRLAVGDRFAKKN
ncbi:MAG: hypothetical protein EHM70_18185 [Chloroflexota bacterium]|nr:MAG: hypothetical protein EHM70_18185 [Chloroflexota bacterium]